MATNITPEDRKRAQMEMANTAQREKISQQETELEKKRRDARLAMEGERHRKRREFEKQVAEKKAILETKRAEMVVKNKEEEKEEKLEEAEKKREEIIKSRQKEDARIERIVASKQELEKLKSSPNINLSSIRTLKSDLAQANRDGDLSLAKMMMKQNREEGKEKSGHEKSSRLFMAGLLMTIITVSIIAGVFWWDSRPVETNSTENPIPTPTTILEAEPIAINAEQYDNLYLSKGLPGVIAEKNLGGSIGQIYFYQQADVLNFKEVNSAGFFGLPENFLSLITGNGMIGVSQDPAGYFFILEVLGRQNTWLYMLENENDIIGSLFATLKGNQARARILNSAFENYVAGNIDVRRGVLSEGSGTAVYGFVDQDWLLIAENEALFAEIIDRYRQN